MGHPGEGVEGVMAGGTDTACLPASRRFGAGTVAAGDQELDEGDDEGMLARALSDPSALMRYMLRVAMESPDLADQSRGDILINLLQNIDTMRSFATAIFLEKLRMDDLGEGVEDSAGGSGRASRPALPQTGAGAAGNTATVGDRDADEGDIDTVSTGVGSSALGSNFQES